MRRSSGHRVPSNDWPQNELGLLAAITLLGALLRLFHLGTWSFWIDEMFTIGRAQSSFNVDTIVSNWPPVSILLTGAALKLFGVSEWTARLVPMLIGIVSIPLLYWPTRKMLGATNARLAALLLAIAPWHLYWSQNARFYTAMLLLYTLALFAFYFGLEQDRPDYILASLVLTFIASRERFMALFFVPVVGVYLLLLKLLPFEKPPGLRARNVGLIMLVGLAAILVDVSRYFVLGQSYFYDSLADFLGRPITHPLHLAAYIASDLGVPLATLAGFGIVFFLLRRSRPGLFLAIGAVLPVMLLLAMSPFVFTKDRYAFVTLFSWIILAAAAATALITEIKGPARVLAVGVMFMLVTDASWDHVQYFQINSGNRPDWSSALALVADRRESGDILASTRPELVAYYLGEDALQMRDIRPDEVASSGKRYWFVVEPLPTWSAGPILPWLQQHGQLIDIRYLRMPEDVSLWIYLYDPASSAGP